MEVSTSSDPDTTSISHFNSLYEKSYLIFDTEQKLRSVPGLFPGIHYFSDQRKFSRLQVSQLSLSTHLSLSHSPIYKIRNNKSQREAYKGGSICCNLQRNQFDPLHRLESAHTRALKKISSSSRNNEELKRHTRGDWACFFSQPSCVFIRRLWVVKLKMGFKRKKSDGEGEGMEAENRGRSNFNIILPSMIKNKEKRSKVYAKQKHEKKLEKQKRIKARDAAEKRALELGEEPPQKMIPKTIENTREFDETFCRPDDEELFADIDADEFNPVLRREVTPKILITTCRLHSSSGPAFASELLSVIPNCHYYPRGTYDLKKIIEYAKKKDFTSLIVVHTNRRKPNALVIIGLPYGPTAHFKLKSLLLRKDIKNHGNPTSHDPELIITNFSSRVGNRLGRLFQSLFPPDPDFRGRRVVTIHCGRDFIFFRHHRYTFETKEIKQSDQGKDEIIKPRLQECGPRFTLTLLSLQRGTFDPTGGEFEWLLKPDMSSKSQFL